MGGREAQQILQFALASGNVLAHFKGLESEVLELVESQVAEE